MSQYAEWIKLEELLDASEEALKQIAAKHPAEIMKWIALRKRMGKNCPNARGVLKLICLLEANNHNFIQSTEEGRWIDGSLPQPT